MPQWVHNFGPGEEGGADKKDLLGNKGANLAEMASIGLPVPTGFTLTTEVCNYFEQTGAFPDSLKEEVLSALALVEKRTGLKFGDSTNPLLVAVRSGAPPSMPGMMDTVLNVGLNSKTVEAMSEKYGDARFALDTYRRFIQMYADVVLGLDVNFEENPGTNKETPRSEARLRARGGGLGEAGARLQDPDFRAAWPRVSNRSFGTALGSGECGLQVMVQSPGQDLPGTAWHPRQVGHCGKCSGHGLREHGQRLRHGCSFH